VGKIPGWEVFAPVISFGSGHPNYGLQGPGDLKGRKWFHNPALFEPFLIKTNNIYLNLLFTYKLRANGKDKTLTKLSNLWGKIMLSYLMIFSAGALFWKCNYGLFVAFVNFNDVRDNW